MDDTDDRIRNSNRNRTDPSPVGRGAADHPAGRGGRVLTRRSALGLLGAGGLVLVGCGRGGDSATTGTVAGAGTADVDTEVDTSSQIPSETAGPFPGDGSNGPDALGTDGVVRSDLTTSFGDLSGTAEGVPLDLRLRVVEAGSGAARPGAAVYAWHCTRDGAYSLYGEAADQNYLRGVQAADDDGWLTFASIFPGAYSGRWPHVHFEVYDSVEAATGDGSPIVTSQLAFPEATCAEVYASAEGYESSAANLDQTSLASDMVFSDGVDHQLAAMSGSLDEGYTAELVIPV